MRNQNEGMNPVEVGTLPVNLKEFKETVAMPKNFSEYDEFVVPETKTLRQIIAELE